MCQFESKERGRRGTMCKFESKNVCESLCFHNMPRLILGIAFLLNFCVRN